MYCPEGHSTHGYKFFQSEAIYLQNPKDQPHGLSVHVHPVWLLSGILEYSTYTTQQIMATFTNDLDNQWRITRYIIKKRICETIYNESVWN